MPEKDKILISMLYQSFPQIGSLYEATYFTAFLIQHSPLFFQGNKQLEKHCNVTLFKT